MRERTFVRAAGRRAQSRSRAGSPPAAAAKAKPAAAVLGAKSMASSARAVDQKMASSVCTRRLVRANAAAPAFVKVRRAGGHGRARGVRRARAAGRRSALQQHQNEKFLWVFGYLYGAHDVYAPLGRQPSRQANGALPAEPVAGSAAASCLRRCSRRLVGSLGSRMCYRCCGRQRCAGWLPYARPRRCPAAGGLPTPRPSQPPPIP